MVKDFTRKVTHQDYKNPEKLKKYYHRVDKKIHRKPRNFTIKDVNMKFTDYIYFDENFIVQKSGYVIIPILGAVISSIIFLIFLFPLDIQRNFFNLFCLVFFSSSFIFFILLGFTMPQKIYILNRKEGLITFPNFLWEKNITMMFSKVQFAYSTGGEDGIGAFILQAIRPNFWQTFDVYTIFGADCYEDMSFITWYMDKNRPLPPGKAFDSFREADYKRRKAEGFPKPLYPSVVKTPEATKEQQAERKRIGGW